LTHINARPFGPTYHFRYHGNSGPVMIKHYPYFFNYAPVILVHDPLAEFLGASEDGLIEYQYADAVALAGHSCPTVAAAYLMTRAALRALYLGAVPERGAIRVEWRNDRATGVTGVMANVVSLITGAADSAGFKGIGGHFERCNRLAFNVPMEGEVRFTRLDNNAEVEVSAHLDSVPMAPAVRTLLPRCITGAATDDERAEFRRLWQTRVHSLLLEHADDPKVIAVHTSESEAA
jgi:formylmethanofuran dehydrogenase subunit E